MKFIRKFGPLILILILSSVLRFQNLGYSEFQDDEKKAFIRKPEGTSAIEFLLNQRKGPMQFFVTSLTLLINNDPRNELEIRLPFTVMNLLAVVVFYLVLKELTQSGWATFLGTFLFSVNGFIVGFSRIAQYQNLNLLFSLLSLLFFIKLSKITKNDIKIFAFSFLGVLFFSLSLLSHWDAIFYLVPSVFFYIKFLKIQSIDSKTKVKVTLFSILFGCVLMLPFLIPYISNQFSTGANSAYFERRVGLSNYPIERHKFIFDLYNPFVTFYLISVLGLFSLIKFKKNFIYILWFVVNFLLIRFFMQKPGTHMYNYVIPAIVLCSFGITLLEGFSKNLKYLSLSIILILCGYLYYQSYMIFVDHKDEYPWDGKVFINTKYLKLEKPVYTDDEIITFGFPHYRNWKEVARVVLSDPDDCGYITNEEKSISQIYLPDNYGIPYNPKCYYIADVRRPFVTEGKLMVFSETVGKKPVYTYQKDGNKLLRLYKITKN